MGVTVGSIFSGVGQVVGKIFGHPLDFLSGKACKSVCAPTWDFLCYIENFCVAQLLKFVMVAILVYFVLLFFYLLFSLGICQCICRTLCHVIWAFISSYFSAIHCCCSFCFDKLRTVKRAGRKRRRRRKQRRDIEEFAAASSTSSSSSSSSSGGGSEEGRELGGMSKSRPARNLECRSKKKNYKEEHLRRSLRPNSHRSGIGLSGNPYDLNRRSNTPNNVDGQVRVTRTSKFSNKGSRYRTRSRSTPRGR